ncbi:MAG: hypothetical protein RLZZ127_2374 [Planctomycetota bacterium]|jgi:thiol-disulfide isomerase/thioredoxin
MRLIALHLATSLALALASTALGAADLKGVSLGTWLSGPKVAPADLAGRVVVFEYWGVNCPPCVANIPHISELATLAAPETLAVIANHCQGPGRTMEVWKSKGGNDRVTVVEGGELPNSNVSGIPRVFVFDHTGKQVFDGHPGKLTAEILRPLIDAAPGPLVSGGPYTACAKEAAALRNTGASIAPVLKSLRSKADGKDGPAKTEATALLAGVKTYLDRQATAFDAAKTSDPLAAMLLLNRMVALTKGDDLAAPFSERLAAAKADKAFQNEVAAAQALAVIKDGIAKIDERMAAPAQRNAKAQAAQALAGLIRKFPGTAAATEAETLAKGLGG